MWRGKKKVGIDTLLKFFGYKVSWRNDLFVSSTYQLSLSVVSGIERRKNRLE